MSQLPAEDREVRPLVTAKAPAEILDGQRADLSWISTEDIVPVPFTSEGEIARLIWTRLEGIDPQALTREVFELAKGRI